MWGWGRPKRDLPEINYNENSNSSEGEEEDYESGLNFNSPLQSPLRPLPSRQGSPVYVEGGPTLYDNVDDTLEEVHDKLLDIAVVREEVEELTDLLEDFDTQVEGVKEKKAEKDSSDTEEIVDTGFTAGEAETQNC